MDNTEIARARTAGQYPRMTPDQQRKDRARERTRTIKFVKYVLLGLMTLDEAARALNMANSTLDRRKRELLNDHQQDTDDLRKIEKSRAYIPPPDVNSV